MTEKLRKSIDHIAQLSEELQSVFFEKLERKTYHKEEAILEVGRVCDYFWFLESGSVRRYYVNDQLDKVTTGLYVPGSWFLDAPSFTGRKASSQTLQAFEDATVFQISIDAIHDLIGQSQAYLQLGKILDQSKAEAYRQDQSPDDRYLELLTREPELLKVFPLRYIASYLGMTPETLSRVRKRISTIS